MQTSSETRLKKVRDEDDVLKKKRKVGLGYISYLYIYN